MIPAGTHKFSFDVDDWAKLTLNNDTNLTLQRDCCGWTSGYLSYTHSTTRWSTRSFQI